MHRSLTSIALSHPLFLAVTPILLLGAENIDQVTLKTLIAPLAVAATGASVVYLMVWALRRDLAVAAVMTTLFVVLFFTYGHAFEALRAAGWFSSAGKIDALLAALSAAILLGGGCWIWRTRRGLGPLLHFCSLTTFILFAIATRQIVHEFKHCDYPIQKTAKSKSPSRRAGRQPPTAQRVAFQRKPNSAALSPDIYYIILDGYARDDVLREVYGYDNSAFTDWLRSRGFFVAQKSCANYPMTFLSLASSLNMRYVNYVTRSIGRMRRRRGPIYRLIEDNQVGRYLKARGYRYVHVSSNWGGTERSKIADVTYSAAHPFLQKEFITVLLRTTMLHRMAPSVAHTHQYALAKLKTIPALAGPTFTFAHLILPHNPHVFDRRGNVRENVPLSMQFDTGEKGEGWKDRRGYLEQLMFVNRKMREIISAIQERSSSPPVIIVQADHGSASCKRTGVSSYKQLDFIRERMPILNAYYVPEKCRQALRHDISPVNSFRVLLNHLFDEKLDILPDKHYFAWYGRPYRLKNVTAMFRGEDENTNRTSPRSTVHVPSSFTSSSVLLRRRADRAAGRGQR